MSTMSGGVVREAEPSMGGGVLYEGGIVSSQHLGVLPDPRPGRAERDRVAREREQHRRNAEAEREKTRLKYVKTQEKVAVSHADVYGGEAEMTLSAALNRIQSLGGQVVAREDNTLTFTLPRQLDESPFAHQTLREQALAAIRTLHAARPVVSRLLRSGRPLPDRQPSAGGGVVPE